MRTAGGKKAGWGERLLSLLFPARCLLCGELVEASAFFCQDCGETLAPEPCRRSFPSPGASFQALAPLPYQTGYRKTLYQFKFRGYRGLADPLGRLMARTTAREFSESFDGVAYVPLSRKKKKERRYDQSELLAKSVAKALGIPLFHLLEKSRETKTQHQLSREERKKNVRGAYRAIGEAQGKTLLLVDDIVTTGATLRECAEVLYRAGAKTVRGLCAADAELRFPETERNEEP